MEIFRNLHIFLCGPLAMHTHVRYNTERNDCAASEPCSSYYQPVCLTCMSAVDESDCKRRGYYDICSVAEVSILRYA